MGPTGRDSHVMPIVKSALTFLGTPISYCRQFMLTVHSFYERMQCKPNSERFRFSKKSTYISSMPIRYCRKMLTVHSVRAWQSQ